MLTHSLNHNSRTRTKMSSVPYLITQGSSLTIASDGQRCTT
jgi:hypothetical protein